MHALLCLGLWVDFVHSIWERDFFPLLLSNDLGFV
jgi:hypothetical protein